MKHEDQVQDARYELSVDNLVPVLVPVGPDQVVDYFCF